MNTITIKTINGTQTVKAGTTITAVEAVSNKATDLAGRSGVVSSDQPNKNSFLVEEAGKGFRNFSKSGVYSAS